MSCRDPSQGGQRGKPQQRLPPCEGACCRASLPWRDGSATLSEMAKTYRRSRGTRLVNSVFQALTRLGLGASYRHILTVPGRKTGRPYSTPVDVIDLDDRRWLVAGYGPSNWVRNVRAAGEVTLSRGRGSDRFDVVEAEALDAVPVLRKYMTEIRVTRPYFDASPDSHDDDVAAELARQPVFRLIRAASEGGHFSSGSSPPSTGKATR